MTIITQQQECIPVGCILPTAVAIGGSPSVHARIYPPGSGPGDPPGCEPGDPPGVGLETPQVWPGAPLGVGLETPQARPLNFPLGCGPGDPLARPLGFPPGCGPGNLQGMLGYHPLPPLRPARHAGIL